MSTDTTRACLRLHMADGVGAVTFGKLVEAFGSVEAAAGATSGQWQRVDGIGPKTAAAMAAVTDAMIDEELAIADQHGVKILTRYDDAYPAALKQIHDPPAVLYAKGDIRQTDAVAVGIVGSRHCTHYGLEQAERFSQLLARAGFTVVSGGARGIDTAAHRGAMTAGGRTIAVMGCGLCKSYPPENAGLFEEIVRKGCGALVSELPMRTAVMSGNFPTRNRIISGLSLGVLVVEAALRSGSLLTARDAADENRVVFGLPGRVDSPLSQGVNKLIRNGAILVQDLDDVLEHLGQVGSKMAPDPAPALPFAHSLEGAEQRLYTALEEGPLNLDELTRRTGLPTSGVISSMTMLVLKGLVKQQAGNVFARKTGS